MKKLFAVGFAVRKFTVTGFEITVGSTYALGGEATTQEDAKQVAITTVKEHYPTYDEYNVVVNEVPERIIQDIIASAKPVEDISQQM